MWCRFYLKESGDHKINKERYFRAFLLKHLNPKLVCFTNTFF